jgi:hypothetical protein
MIQYIIVSGCSEVDVVCDGENSETEVVIVPIGEKYFGAMQDTCKVVDKNIIDTQ